MKILSLADIHGSQYRLNIVLKNIEKYTPDLIVICGDITQFGPADVAINILNQIKVKTLAIHGNIDSNEILKAIDYSKAINIHLKKEIVDNIPFIGIGGEIDVQFDLQIKVNASFKPIGEILDKSTVLVTHIPPYGLQDKFFLGLNSGSKDLKKIINKYNPRLVLCGHIHENPGFIKFKNTTIINCSIGKTGGGALIELNNKINVKMLD
ncbi:MAG: metallophosphoesterase family protein [Candidatus Thermoplasmatota archaeon]|nr:metallophosphoesterase family protein [Candidatus Thermoplasmatota archaeon]